MSWLRMSQYYKQLLIKGGIFSSFSVLTWSCEGSGWGGRPSGREISDNLWGFGSCQKVVGRYERDFVTAEALQHFKDRRLVQRDASLAPALLHLPFHQPRVCRAVGQRKTSPSRVVRDQHSISGSGNPWAQKGRACWGRFAACSTSHFPWATAIGNCWRQDTGLEGSVVSLWVVVFMLYSVR